MDSAGWFLTIAVVAFFIYSGFSGYLLYKVKIREIEGRQIPLPKEVQLEEETRVMPTVQE